MSRRKLVPSKTAELLRRVKAPIILKILLLLVFSFVLTYVGYKLTWVNKQIFDLLDSPEPDLLRASLIIYVLLTLGRALIVAVHGYQLDITTAQLHIENVIYYFSKMTSSAYQVIDGIRHGEIQELLWTDTWGPTAFVPMFVVNVLGGIIRTLLYFGVLVILIPHVLVIALIQALVSMVLPQKLFQSLKNARSKVRQIQEDLRVSVQEWYHALAEITLHNMEEQLKRHLARLHNNLFLAELTSMTEDIKIGIIRQGAYKIAIVLALTTSAIAISFDWLTIGAVMAGILLLNDFLSNVAQLAGLKADLQMHSARIDRLDNFEHRLSLDVDLPFAEQVSINQIPNTIQFDSVYFGYTETLVLDNFSCDIPRNKVTVIQGASGSGKSTILKLILGLYAPDSGKISIGVESGKYGLYSAYVPQEHRWFNETLLYNLTLGRDIPREEINKALKLAQAEFIHELPDGLSTIMSDTTLGKTMSTGQLQRLAIARALCVDSPVLLLDEPTSNLDVASSQLLCELLKDLAQDHTVVVVTHSSEVASYGDHLIDLGGALYDADKI